MQRAKKTHERELQKKQVLHFDIYPATALNSVKVQMSRIHLGGPTHNLNLES